MAKTALLLSKNPGCLAPELIRIPTLLCRLFCFPSTLFIFILHFIYNLSLQPDFQRFARGLYRHLVNTVLKTADSHKGRQELFWRRWHSGRNVFQSFLKVEVEHFERANVVLNQ